MSVAPAHKLLFGRLYHSVWNERSLEFIEQVISETHALGDPHGFRQGSNARQHTAGRWNAFSQDCRT